MKKQRIWEIDALRGLCILFVFAAHLAFDLREFLQLDFRLGPLQALFDYGGAVFIVISGVSATLGSRSFRRGLIVFGYGMVITAVTCGMVLLDMLDSSNVILFGVLHLLGVCMMLYPLLKKLPTWLLAVLGAVIVALGYWFSSFYLPPAVGRFDPRQLLFLFGLRLSGFTAGDYFPLLPHLGWFMLGIVLGRTVYAEGQTRLPKVPAGVLPLRFLQFAGRHSLELYLIHQPVIFGIIQLISLLGAG